MKIFVDSPLAVLFDSDAAARLAQTNDTRFATDDGVLTVDAARWQQAQAYERETWLTYNRDATDDRNGQHAAAFGNYATLPATLGDVVELGCGAFTNLRYIVQGRTVDSITLLDPLLNDYEAQMTHCTYKGWHLGETAVTGVASTIEAWETDRQFDTLVMINTLAHCHDAHRVFDTIRRVMKRGGYLVFHETARPAPVADYYDVGHPIAVEQWVLDTFLSEFETVYQQPNYFIGRRK